LLAPRPIKLTFGEMRASGVTGILIYCADFKCSHVVPIAAPEWADDVRLSDIEDRFVCQACGKRGADVRPDFPKAVTGTPNTRTPERPMTDDQLHLRPEAIRRLVDLGLRAKK
jgi:hypothetical protein